MLDQTVDDGFTSFRARRLGIFLLVLLLVGLVQVVSAPSSRANSEKRQLLWKYQTDDIAGSVAVSENGEFIATGGFDGKNN